MNDQSGQPPALRASDAERDQAVSTLRDAVVEGRLTLEEFTDRVGAAQLARIHEELSELVADVPGTRTAPAAAPRVEHRAICSHLVRKGPWTLPAQSSFRSLCGTIDLDLRQATIEAAEVDMAIHNVFGTVTVIVPEGTLVQVDGGGLFASEHLDTSAVSPVPGAPVIRIHSSGMGGTLYVRTREPRRLVDRLLEAARG